jgi:hypothetical protein
MFDLGKWRIQLPVNSSGGLSGDMKIVNPAKTVAPWFIAWPDRLEFTCPAKGATSPGTTSPRTELAENNRWLMERGGEMHAALTVDAIPPNGGMIIAQVWNRDEALMLDVYPDGSMFVFSHGIPVTYVGNVPIGTPFTYRVEVAGGGLRLDINGQMVFWRSTAPWIGKKFYFKAGAYCGADAVADKTALFKSTFTFLKIFH